ncbi:uncharacterized protein RSE6_15083 [Rhynchosporium secalis]|uniref:Uncharacterized protein n=1 Tax=Rhynchosporium secalis TaxID=38038 RepID=A0A1E1MWP0_RHYSE|nr:uncharacterized protein RSE6_15083 [Rhynchosporium secalis]
MENRRDVDRERYRKGLRHELSLPTYLARYIVWQGAIMLHAWLQATDINNCNGIICLTIGMYGMKPKPATEPSSITNYLPTFLPFYLSSQTNTKPGNNADVVKHRSPDHDYSAPYGHGHGHHRDIFFSNQFTRT